MFGNPPIFSYLTSLDEVDKGVYYIYIYPIDQVYFVQTTTNSSLINIELIRNKQFSNISELD